MNHLNIFGEGYGAQVDCLNIARHCGSIAELAPQRIDVDAHSVGKGIGLGAPNMLQQCFLADDLAAPAQQIFQDAELFARQPAVAVCSRARGGVEHQFATLKQRRAHAQIAAQQRAHTRAQLFVIKRLGQVIIGTGVEAGHTLLNLRARGQDDDQQPGEVGAQPPTNIQPIHIGQAEVENRHIVLIYRRQLQRLLAARGRVDSVAIDMERQQQQRGNIRRVVDDKETHNRYSD